MTRVLRPLKVGEGGHAPLCEMVESTQAQVYEAMANYLDDLMTPEAVKMFSSGKETQPYLVKLDDGRTVVTRRFKVEHPSDSKDCLSAYQLTRNRIAAEDDRPKTDHHIIKGIAGFLLSGMIYAGFSRHTPPAQEMEQ